MVTLLSRSITTYHPGRLWTAWVVALKILRWICFGVGAYCEYVGKGNKNRSANLFGADKYELWRTPKSRRERGAVNEMILRNQITHTGAHTGTHRKTKNGWKGCIMSGIRMGNRIEVSITLKDSTTTEAQRHRRHATLSINSERQTRGWKTWQPRHASLVLTSVLTSSQHN